MPNCLLALHHTDGEFRYNEHGVYGDQSEDEESEAF